MEDYHSYGLKNSQNGKDSANDQLQGDQRRFEVTWVMDQFAYIKILEEVRLPYAEEEMPLKWIFQQDHDPKHTSKRAASWFQTNKIKVMAWPAQSPDLKPIENLWGDIENAVSEAKPINAEEL
ncbi:hypothetical protein P4O66_015368 [Electrophorus voltai]|uniref:Tc1-like transposase DDE domain-containing protein n=1 Tax=Electrophorus voltai TaxID=2609070 RepID=A0AAD8Z183_9TELE|nr:hypothetical protein P4O66_015368 [Electrophorus voltai]